jgi:hypothetical protein
MALVKYNNNSISDVTELAGVPTGAMTLIKTVTASSDSTIDFVDGTSDVVLDSTYPIYFFKFINIHASADDVGFRFQGNAAGGSGFNETITSSGFDAYHAENGSAEALRYLTGADQAQGTSYQNLSTSETENDASLSGYLYLFSPSNTTFVKHFMSRIQDTHASYTTDSYYAGYFNTTSAIDEISFKFASGNIDSGTFKLYGIKDS